MNKHREKCLSCGQPRSRTSRQYCKACFFRVKKGVQQNCVHHFVISTPDGSDAVGVCKHCGRVKLFSNYVQPSHMDLGHSIRNN
jgi:NMD protein affecting ribosome stability and mRNA decay